MEEVLTRENLIELLKKLNIPISEGTPRDEEIEEDARICFWDYVWEDVTASGLKYNTKVTYQISFIASKPREPKLLELKTMLNETGLFPTIYHEYDPETRRWHSYFSLEVLENV